MSAIYVRKFLEEQITLQGTKKIHTAHDYECEENKESETEEESNFEESSSDIDVGKDDIRTSYVNWILEKIQV